MNIARVQPNCKMNFICNKIHVLLESTRNVTLNHGNSRWVTAWKNLDCNRDDILGVKSTFAHTATEKLEKQDRLQLKDKFYL